MNTRHHRSLLDCYLSDQVTEAQWTEHLKDAEFAKFVASEMGVAKPGLTLGVRERAFEKYLASPDYRYGDAGGAFKAGWNARKHLGGVGLPPQSKGYQPHAPFKAGGLPQPQKKS